MSDQQSETILYAVKKGDEDWQEQVITTCRTRIPAAKKWATENGFDRFRVATIDLTKVPDFSACVRRNSR